MNIFAERKAALRNTPHTHTAVIQIRSTSNMTQRVTAVLHVHTSEVKRDHIERCFCRAFEEAKSCPVSVQAMVFIAPNMKPRDPPALNGRISATGMASINRLSTPTSPIVHEMTSITMVINPLLRKMLSAASIVINGQHPKDCGEAILRAVDERVEHVGAFLREVLLEEERIAHDHCDNRQHAAIAQVIVKWNF
ncbi:MAG: hydrogenase iron-sulfur subunit [Flavobacteriales bacterium]|nr:hydrogenase iron-sulfur subunit [Flavobacteriales bacterium]